MAYNKMDGDSDAQEAFAKARGKSMGKKESKADKKKEHLAKKCK